MLMYYSDKNGDCYHDDYYNNHHESIYEKNMRTEILHCTGCGESSNSPTFGNGTFYDKLAANNYSCGKCSR